MEQQLIKLKDILTGVREKLKDEIPLEEEKTKKFTKALLMKFELEQQKKAVTEEEKRLVREDFINKQKEEVLRKINGN